MTDRSLGKFSLENRKSFVTVYRATLEEVAVELPSGGVILTQTKQDLVLVMVQF